MKQLFIFLAILGLMTVAVPSFGAWTVVDLGTLNPDNSGTSEGLGISDDGAYVVGLASSPSDATSTPFRFNDVNGNFQVDPGEMLNLLDILNADLPPEEAFTAGTSTAVNNSGIAIGRTLPVDMPFRVTDPFYHGQAVPEEQGGLNGINEAGLAVGSSHVPGNPGNAYVLEVDDTWTLLPSTAGWTGALDINDNNMICGFDNDGGGIRQGAVWEHNGSAWVKTILPALGGNTEGEAWGLNDFGQVVGINKVSGERRAVLWEDTGSGWTITVLDGGASYAYDINNAGVIVGKTGSEGRIWIPTGGGSYNVTHINDRIPDSDWYVRVGTGISDHGWVVGQGQYNNSGIWHAVVIVEPLPIPGDADKDGDVDDDDAAALANNWQKQSGALWAEGDFNGDFKVDDLDATIMATNWTGPLAAAVPEPTSLTMLLCVAISAMLLIRQPLRD